MGQLKDSNVNGNLSVSENLNVNEKISSKNLDVTNNITCQGNITGGGGSLINLINDYTPNKEIIIGKFYDGKTLYQQIKVFNNIAISTGVNINHNINSIDRSFIHQVLLMHKDSDVSAHNFTSPFVSSSGAVTGFRINRDSIFVGANDTWGNKTTRDIVFVIRYTKL